MLPADAASFQAFALPARSWWRWPSFAAPTSGRESAQLPRPYETERVAKSGAKDHAIKEGGHPDASRPALLGCVRTRGFADLVQYSLFAPTRPYRVTSLLERFSVSMACSILHEMSSNIELGDIIQGMLNILVGYFAPYALLMFNQNASPIWGIFPSSPSYFTRTTNLLLSVDKPLSLLPAEAHHLVPALAVRLVPHPLHLGLHPRLPKTAFTSRQTRK